MTGSDVGGGGGGVAGGETGKMPYNWLLGGMLGGVGMMAALYGMFGKRRPKRMFLAEPEPLPAEEMTTVEELSLSPEEMENGRHYLAMLIEDWRWSGIDDYDHRRPELEKKGIKSPADMEIPKDPVHAILWASWRAGWDQARIAEAVGLPKAVRGEQARGTTYVDAVLAAGKRAKECDAAENRLQVLIDAIRSLANVVGDPERDAKVEISELRLQTLTKAVKPLAEALAWGKDIEKAALAMNILAMISPEEPPAAPAGEATDEGKEVAADRPGEG